MQRLGTQPTAAFSAARIRVYRSDSLGTLMQEECAHFRVDAIRRRKRGPAGPLFVNE